LTQPKVNRLYIKATMGYFRDPMAYHQTWYERKRKNNAAIIAAKPKYYLD